MAIPISSSVNQLNANSFIQEGFELSLDAIVPSIELTGSFTPFQSKTQFYIYDYAKIVLYENLNYNADGSYLPPPTGTSTSTSTSSYNQFVINPTEDVYNQGYSNGNYYAVYNFIDYELGSELSYAESPVLPDNSLESDLPSLPDYEIGQYDGYPYFIKEISGDRTELKIQNNFLNHFQIQSYYNEFENKLNARENADEFYVSFGNNRNFIGVNSQLEMPPPGSSQPISILIKLYKPLPPGFEVEQQLQIISKVGETQVFGVQFHPDLEFVDNLLSLKGPNYNVDIKDRINNSTNFKNLKDLINTNSSQSYYQFNSLRDQKGIILRKNWGDWNEFVKYSSAEQRLNNFYDKMVSIEGYEAEITELETIIDSTTASIDYSSSYNDVSNNINKVISKFDSYEYFLYYITGSESWPKYTSTYPYTNYSYSSSAILNWFGSTDENNAYYNSGKNQIYSASRYDNSNQDYLYYLIPPFITDNSSNDQYIKFVNMTGQTFDEMYIYTEAIEQVRNTNSSLTGSVLPLGLADDVIESLGFDTYGNDFNSQLFNPNSVGVLPATGSGLEYITRYIDIASGSVINYYDQQQSTLGYVIALADPSFPYPIENSAQEIYKRIFHNMVSLVKRKGTVTGLRQLINIWGVPNTMLRISEFGGKNKDDENDYDLWMNRYSTAFDTYSTPHTSSIPNNNVLPNVNSCVTIPWQPLVANYYQEVDVTQDVALPDCIQFRFKTATSASATTNFSESLLFKRAESTDTRQNGEFGVYLHQSGSQSGSYSGSSDPHYNTYASMSFVMSGSLDQGASDLGTFAHVYVTDPIYLPFYNKEWWTVQIQRKLHYSASNVDNKVNEFELRVGQNIYDGYDGNQIGWVGSSSLTMIDSKVSASMNESWNLFSDTGFEDENSITTLTCYNSSSIYLPGNILVSSSILPFEDINNTTWNSIGLSNTYPEFEGPGFSLGKPLSGSFQEFRYYRRALSSSQFNDFVMNPESIQGHSNSNTGAGSSYDLLSFRAPLGNELEYTEPLGSASYSDSIVENIRQFTYGNQRINILDSVSPNNSLGSVHPSVVNSSTSSTLYTASFFNPNTLANFPVSNCYALNFRFDSTPNLYVTSSYVTSNTEINYMDQPSAGIRNRIKNKIQVIDKNEYGTILSPFRSIQQEFEQSSSYTEDINSLEVGFSFQNEINDDIIATFGHGVVSDAIADPRFISESSDRYPELTRIAEDYFKKYQGYPTNTSLYNEGLPTVIEKEYDYNRLIKFYETSLFKAIKNYVPARTSLSTGIIVKQHLLERNKTDAVIGMHTNTPIAKTPETGSDSWGYTDQTGFNSVLSQQNLLITSSINMYSLTGSAGGSVNKYNIMTDEGAYNHFEGTDIDISTTPVNLFPSEHAFAGSPINIKIFLEEDANGDVYLESTVALSSQVGLRLLFDGVPGSPADIKLETTSSKRGGIWDYTFENITLQDTLDLVTDTFITVYPDERLYFNISSDVALTIDVSEFTFGEEFNSSTNFTQPEPSASQQVNWYIDPFTGDWKVDDYQTEFYDGEFSGSNFETLPTQYNPYRIYADGNDQTPDTVLTAYCDFTLGGGTTFWTVVSSTEIKITPGYSVTAGFKRFTGSFHDLELGQEYTITYTLSNSSGMFPNNNAGVLTDRNAASPSVSWSGFTDPTPYSNGIYTTTFTATDLHIPGIVDSGGVWSGFTSTGATLTITINSIEPSSKLGPKHFYPRDGWSIIPTGSQLFQNSPYNPILNNVSGSRRNSFLFDMDFDPPSSGSTLIEGIPSDYTLIVSASQLGWEGTATADALLEFSEVPDSNYTTPSIINPRYVGCLLESADYNFYTGIPSQSTGLSGIKGLSNTPALLKQHKVRYINGETGSWGGDISYGKNAVIDHNPIYFAHFKQSYENLSIFDTTTFVLDQLIQVPFEEILSQQSPIITSSLINASNENLIPVSSTFGKGRKATAYYKANTRTFSNFNLTLNYNTLNVGSNPIFATATDFKTYFSNQSEPSTTTNKYVFSQPSWIDSRIDITTTKGWGGPRADLAYEPQVNLQTTIDLPTPNLSSSTIQVFETGSSTHAENLGLGILELRGPIDTTNLQVNLSLGGSNYYKTYLRGPILMIYNTLNQLTKEGDQGPQDPTGTGVYKWGLQTTLGFTSTTYVSDGGTGSYFGSIPLCPNSFGMYIPGAGGPSGPVRGRANAMPILDDKDNIENYWTYNFSSSNLSAYEQIPNTKFMIEKGDEIRVTYKYPSSDYGGATSSPGILEVITQDFTVIDYELAPCAVATDPTDPLHTGGDFHLTLPNLITSSSPQYKGMATQIGEYYKRMNIAKTNGVCFYLMAKAGHNATLDGCGSGSFISDVAYSGYVENVFGENNPTVITVSCSFSDFRSPNTLSSGTKGWILGTNPGGTSKFKSIDPPGGGNPPFSESYYQVAPYLTDEEDVEFRQALDAGFVYNRLRVSPNPRTLAKPIPSGSILAATIRKRIEDDSRVVINLAQPSGSKGISTPSGDGYLIPNDLTYIQQGNVQKIINKLQSENVFIDNSDNTTLS